ncbi:MFS transporter [Micromonospora sp. NPDC048871]|uniref:MFS transporter n=1 Tax=unclassified Micromonospora TaxID=2617518 RepID=UPI002E136051|nr:MFS transporter [Micromonospora sp. NBC_01739]
MESALTAPPAPPAELARVRRWPVSLVLAGVMFLVLFDSLAVATALPQIGREFAISPDQLQWVITLYSLSIGGFLLLGGRVCDLWGRRRLIVTSLGVNTFGLLLAGATSSLPLLFAGRVLQGLGAAFAIPAALASAAALFPEEPWRSRVFAVVAAAANSAGLAGAVCGGVITSYWGWRWIFLAVVPVGLVAMLAALRLLPPDQPTAGRRSLDVTGALLATGGLVILIYGATRVAEQGLSGPAPAIVVAGLLLLAVLVPLERRIRDPLLKPALFRSRSLTASCLAFAAHSASYAAIVVVGSLHLQEIHGLSAAQTGLVLAPVLLGSLISAAPAGWLVRRYGPRTVVTVALTLCAGSLAGVAVGTGGSLPIVIAWLVAWGLSAGPVYVALTRECIGAAAPEDRGSASALFESTNHVGGALSVAAFLTLLGAGVGYGTVQLVGAAVVGLGILATIGLMPRSKPQTRT